MDLFKYCRTCTEEKMDMINIHEMRNNGTSISDMLVCVGIDEALSSVLPQQMCSCCETKLQTVYNFHLQCRTSYAKFLNCLKIEASETKVQNCYKIGDEYSSEHKDDGDDHQFKYELNEDTNEDEENGTALLQKSTNIDTNITDCKSEDVTASDNETEIGKTNMESDKQTTDKESDGGNKHSSYCSMCSKSFYTEKALMFHQRFVHKNSFTQDSAITTNIEIVQTLECPQCSQVLKTKDELKLHLSKCIKKQSDSPKIIESEFECATCRKKFTNASRYRHHMLYHSNSTYMCSIDDCAKTYTVEYKLIDHMKRFHGFFAKKKLKIKPTGKVLK